MRHCYRPLTVNWSIRKWGDALRREEPRERPLNSRFEETAPKKVSPARVKSRTEGCQSIFDLDQTTLLTIFSNLREAIRQGG